jgi:hypothetical protein
VSLYERGDVWWYKFWFNGQLIRESSKSNSKTVAKDAERARRRELEQAYNLIPKRERDPLFSHVRTYGWQTRRVSPRRARNDTNNAWRISKIISARDSFAMWTRMIFRNTGANAWLSASAIAR